MSIPDYQSIMLPLLKILADNKEHVLRDLVEDLSKEFSLSDEERKELLPSGQQPLFDNRVAWAKTYLKKARLIDQPKRAIITITPRGLDVLKDKPLAIDTKYLKRFPEFVDFRINKKDNNISTAPDEQPDEHNSEKTPKEILDYAYQNIRKTLAQELLGLVMTLAPYRFERLVIELLVKMGYGGSIKDAGKAVGRTNDEGIDGIIKEDKLGLDVIYIQAKRWQGTVGRPEIQKFVGALAGQGAKKGIFITTSSFTKEAIEYTPRNETKIVLIDGEQLAQLMVDYNLGVSTVNIYEVKRIDTDYFGDDISN